MSNRRKPKNPTRLIQPEALSRMARPSCDQCGAAVKWVGPEEATAHGMNVAQALQWHGVASADGLDIWICTRCDNGGVMGPTEINRL